MTDIINSVGSSDSFAPPPCPLCHAPMRAWHRVPGDWRRPEDRQAYRLHWCDQDGYGCLSPPLSEEETQAAYALPDYFTHQRWHDAPCKEGSGIARRLLAHLAWRLDRSEPLNGKMLRTRFGSKPITICDLGCGNGELLAELAGDGHTLLGVEPDPTARAVANERGLLVMEGTAERIPAGVPRGGCDLVILQHVLEHCREPISALRAARALLRPGGTLLCEVPNLSALGARRNGDAWHWLDVPRHIHFFTPESLRGHCERAGWTVTRMAFDGYCRQFERPWLEAEAEIRSRFFERDGIMRPPSRPWRLLLATGLSHSAQKYDSVRVEAR